MAKRAKKLTRADKMRLSEEQKKAAGVTDEPSSYALKTALENGADDPRLGESWKEKASAQSGTVIGQADKSTKPRFTQQDAHRLQAERAQHIDKTKPIPHARTPAAHGPKKKKPKIGKLQIKENQRVVLDPNTETMRGAGLSFISLAFNNVAHFDTLGTGAFAIDLPPPPQEYSENCSTFFAALETGRRTERNEHGREGIIRSWMIERHISDDPENGLPTSTEIVWEGETSPRHILRMFRNWANGAEIATQQNGYDPEYLPRSQMVVSQECWKYLRAGGKIQTRSEIEAELMAGKDGTHVITSPDQEKKAAPPIPVEHLIILKNSTFLNMFVPIAFDPN